MMDGHGWRYIQLAERRRHRLEVFEFVVSLAGIAAVTYWAVEFFLC
jgi:hypothetical protein